MAELQVVEALVPAFAWQVSPLFRFCGLPDWENFAGFAILQNVAAGEILWEEDQVSSLLICVINGRLEAIKKTPGWDKPVIMAEFAGGATIGELVFDDEACHSTTLRAVTDVRMLTLNGAGVAALLAAFPETAARLWRGAALLQLLRLRRANVRLAALF
ncbi:MAG: cyclic nucleotide-binding domain-containing protein [Deltaproteobacteria bacterium]|nr:cyclic nucleotide-binding domain-containing protein [Deltaproteobacteria bacterium]